jgi:hypothetical protein
LTVNRFSETENALVERLRALKAAPEMSLGLLEVAMPLSAAGFTQEEIKAVLDALEQEKILAYAPGNRLLILKEPPKIG